MSYEYEDELKYLVDMVESTDNMDWAKAVVDLNVNMHPDSLRKSFNVGRYSGYKVYKYMQNKMESEYLADEEILKLESLRDEIYKEKCKLQDANREKRAVLREEARYENLVEVLKDSISDLYDIDLKPYKESKSKTKKTAVLQLSDWHCGSKVDHQFGYYDIATMIDRAGVIKNKAIKYCKLHGVTNLIVEINGDMLDGAIHVSSRVEQEEGVINQIATVTNVLANFINDLKPYFENIKVYTTLGNHGRLTPNKHDSVTKENFETLIPLWLRDKLKDVTVIDSKGLDFLKYDIDGKTICMAHGQNDKLTTCISDFSKLFKVVPSEIHLGHTHAYKDINDCDTIVTVNGSLVGSDEYSLTLRKVTKPSQNLIVYEDDRCIYELKAE